MRMPPWGASSNMFLLLPAAAPRRPRARAWSTSAVGSTSAIFPSFAPLARAVGSQGVGPFFRQGVVLSTASQAQGPKGPQATGFFCRRNVCTEVCKRVANLVARFWKRVRRRPGRIFSWEWQKCAAHPQSARLRSRGPKLHDMSSTAPLFVHGVRARALRYADRSDLALLTPHPFWEGIAHTCRN